MTISARIAVEIDAKGRYTACQVDTSDEEAIKLCKDMLAEMHGNDVAFPWHSFIIVVPFDLPSVETGDPPKR